MKSQLRGAVTATLLCLCALAALPGCTLFDVNKMVQDNWKRQEAKLRQAVEAQQQKQRVQQAEQDRQTMKSQKPIKVGEEIPVQFADVQLEGNWKGNACNQQMAIAIKMTTRWNKGFNWRSTIQTEDVRGVFRSTSQPQQANPRIIETGLEGKFDLKAGFLTLTSIPKPPTEEEVKEENRLRTEEANERKRLDEKYSTDLYWAMYKMQRAPKDQQAQMQKDIYLMTKTQEERILAIAAKQTQRMSDQSAAAKAALVSFKIDMAKNADGSGWAGIMEGGDFDGCEIALVSEGGIRTDKLPPVTSQVALERARHHNYIKPSPFQAYWLDIAAKDAREEDYFEFGSYYDRQGERVPAYYSRASHYYQIVVERNGDARAQEKLARLYESGLGIPKDLEKAQQLYRLAGETRKKALSVCTSSATKNFASRMMAQQHRTTQGLESMVGMFTPIQMQSGNSRVIAIEAVDVATMDKRFHCKFVSKRIDPKVDAELVPDGYYIEEPYGNIRYEDNSINKAAATMGAAFLQKLAETVPFNNWVRVEPLGKLQYQLFWKDHFNKADEIVTVN